MENNKINSQQRIPQEILDQIPIRRTPGQLDAYAEQCVKACAGLPDGALDGGWTAAGLSAYTAKLERALAPFAKHPEFQAPDEWAVTIIDEENRTPGVTAGDFRRAKEALGHNVMSASSHTPDD